MDNLLKYRITSIQPSFTDGYSELKIYDNLQFSINTELEEFIDIYFINEEFINCLGFTIEFGGNFQLDLMEIYYLKDEITWQKLSAFDYIKNNNLYTFYYPLQIKGLKFKFLYSSNIIINNIEIYENFSEIENNLDFSDLFRKQKILEMKNPPSFISQKNLGKIYNQYMEKILSE